MGPLAFVVVLLLVGAPEPAVDGCLRALSRVEGGTESPVVAVPNACGRLFSNPDFRECWQRIVTVHPNSWAIVLSDCAADLYCHSTKGKDLRLCTLGEGGYKKLSAAELDADWRQLMKRIVEADLGDDAARMWAGFDQAWPKLFPQAAPVVEKRKGVDGGITSAEPTVMGSLDEESVRQVIHRNRNQVRYCYERELVRTPGLRGKLAVKFVIGADGSVQSAVIGDSDLGSTAVEGCVTAKVRTWVFPKAKGGGIVVVTYPFVFRPAEPN